MKHAFLTIIFCLVKAICFSQDTLIKIPRDTIICKVLEINSNEIKYKPYDFLDGPVRAILRAEVYLIVYENGKVDTITSNYSKSNVTESSEGRTSSSSSSDYYSRGIEDAEENYHGYHGAGTVTLIPTLFFPPAGLIPAIMCSSTPPNENHLNYPKESLMRKPNYREGYTFQAYKIKRGKVWMNFGIGVGVWALLIVYGATQ